MRDARGLTSMTWARPRYTTNWMLQRPRTRSAQRDAHGVGDDLVAHRRVEPRRRVRRHRVAAVHAGALDVLHQAGDHHRLAVADGVDVDLGAEQVLVDEHGAAPAASRPRGAPPSPPPGSARARRGCAPPPWRGRRARTRAAPAPGSRCASPISIASARSVVAAPRGCGMLQRAHQRLEGAPVLGGVDGVDVAAEDGHAGGVQRARQVDRGLAAELHDDPARTLGRDHRQSATRRRAARSRAGRCSRSRCSPSPGCC